MLYYFLDDHLIRGQPRVSEPSPEGPGHEMPNARIVSEARER